MELPGSSALTHDWDGNESMMELSITALVSILRTAFRTADYDRVEEVLVAKETKQKAEIGALCEKLEMERLERMNVEEQLQKYKEQRDKGRRKAEGRYEKLLEALKTENGLETKKRKLMEDKKEMNQLVISGSPECGNTSAGSSPPQKQAAAGEEGTRESPADTRNKVVLGLCAPLLPLKAPSTTSFVLTVSCPPQPQPQRPPASFRYSRNQRLRRKIVL